MPLRPPGRRPALIALVLTTATLATGLGGCGASNPRYVPVAVTGAVDQPQSWTATTVPAELVATQTDTFSSAGAAQTHTYTGASTWGLLSAAGVQVDPAVKNDLLSKIVVATGRDGYRTVFALGELSPDFGARASLVAWDEVVAGMVQLADPTAQARITVPGDVKGGRYVSLLASLEVRPAGGTFTTSGGGVSTAFAVSGDVLRPAAFDAAALAALPTVTQAVGTDTYTGVPLWSLLSTTAGLKTDPAAKNADLTMVVVATGTDGYRAVFSLGELDPGFGAQPDLVATAQNGVPLSTDGFARLVVPGDVKHGRWVSNLASLEVLTVAP